MCKNVAECRYFDPDTKHCMLLKTTVFESNENCPKFRDRTWNTQELEKPLTH
jgi:hypothetical protein